ncbi:MAG TPA: hypothetical protein VLS53_07475 [Candidatus Dormibacteraeota bacterium]|nr:hypothetical protein [Candidatus Dormibacteraeota bacterium]
MTATVESQAFASVRQAFVGRVTQSCLGMFDIVTMYIGERRIASTSW